MNPKAGKKERNKRVQSYPQSCHVFICHILQPRRLPFTKGSPGQKKNIYIHSVLLFIRQPSDTPKGAAVTKKSDVTCKNFASFTKHFFTCMCQQCK